MIELRYKNDTIFRAAHIVPWHPILIDLIQWEIDQYGALVVTSAWRSGDKGVHGTIGLRGLDIRSGVQGFIGREQEIEDEINAHWVYDPNRLDKKVCLYHDAGSGPHFHTQVHPRTVRVQ